MSASERFTIRRRIELDAAHRVPDHKSKCHALHGHRYKVDAVLSGPLWKEGEQKGMVMDFGFLKHLMMQEIHEPCDHGLILWAEDYAVLDTILCPPSYSPAMMQACREKVLTPPLHIPAWLKLYRLPSVPTAENLAFHWYHVLDEAITKFFSDRGESREGIVLEELKVYETPNCTATYRPETQLTSLREHWR